MEIWKDIKGFEMLYKISTYGRIKSFKKDKNGYILSIKNKAGNYLSITISDINCIKHYYKVHRLVAMTFLDNPNDLEEVNHKDFDRQNNNVTNLEWVSHLENIHHALNGKKDIMLSKMIYYNQNIRPKAVLQYDKSGSLLAEFKSCKEASIITGVCSRNINQVANKTEYKPGMIRKQAGGFVWMYKKEVI